MVELVWQICLIRIFLKKISWGSMPPDPPNGLATGLAVGQGRRPTPFASVGPAARQHLRKLLHMAEVLKPPSATPPTIFIIYSCIPCRFSFSFFPELFRFFAFSSVFGIWYLGQVWAGGQRTSRNGKRQT